MPPEEVRQAAVEESPLQLEADAPLEAKTDGDLAELFRKASSGVGDGLEEKETPAPTVDPNTDKIATLEADHQRTREELIELKTQNEIYRSGLLRQQQAPQQQVVQQQPSPAPKGLLEELGVTETQLTEGLRTNAAGTITSLVEKASERAYQRAKSEATVEATSAASAAAAMDNAFRQDQAAASAEYGQLLADNKEFAETANKIYAQITASGRVIGADGTKWTPNSIYLATSTAYAQMARAGKFAAAVAEPPKPGIPGLKLVEKPKAPLSPTLGGPSDTSSGGNPLTAGLSTDDLAQIKSSAKKLGIPEERYLKTYQAMRKRDPSFGGGA